MLTLGGCTAAQPIPDATPTVIPFPTFTATPAGTPDELRWLSLNGEPSVKLPIWGTALRWGL